MPIPDKIFSNDINVRIDDINYGNHLGHIEFISLIHNTRALFLKKYGLSELDCFGCSLVMLELDIKYSSQCFFDDKLEISLSISEMEKASALFSYIVYNHTSNKIAAKATTLMGFMDAQKEKLRKIPVEFIELINKIKK